MEGKKLVYMLIIFLIFAYTLEAAQWHGTTFPRDISNIFKGLNISFVLILVPIAKKEKNVPLQLSIFF
jgi:hypothetical protein